MGRLDGKVALVALVALIMGGAPGPGRKRRHPVPIRGGGRQMVTERIPMGYMTTADDVANLALFPASDDSSYCAGSELIVAGGFTA